MSRIDPSINKPPEPRQTRGGGGVGFQWTSIPEAGPGPKTTSQTRERAELTLHPQLATLLK